MRTPPASFKAVTSCTLNRRAKSACSKVSFGMTSVRRRLCSDPMTNTCAALSNAKKSRCSQPRNSRWRNSRTSWSFSSSNGTRVPGRSLFMGLIAGCTRRARSNTRSFEELGSTEAWLSGRKLRPSPQNLRGSSRTRRPVSPFDCGLLERQEGPSELPLETISPSGSWRSRRVPSPSRRGRSSRRGTSTCGRRAGARRTGRRRPSLASSSTRTSA
jgi:hypothetical protein